MMMLLTAFSTTLLSGREECRVCSARRGVVQCSSGVMVRCGMSACGQWHDGQWARLLGVLRGRGTGAPGLETVVALPSVSFQGAGWLLVAVQRLGLRRSPSSSAVIYPT